MHPESMSSICIQDWFNDIWTEFNMPVHWEKTNCFSFWAFSWWLWIKTTCPGLGWVDKNTPWPFFIKCRKSPKPRNKTKHEDTITKPAPKTRRGVIRSPLFGPFGSANDRSPNRFCEFAVYNVSCPVKVVNLWLGRSTLWNRLR